MYKFEITVIIATYEPDPVKLMRTVRSVIMQRDVDMEVILTDDGSVNNDFSEVERYIHEIGFDSFYIIRNKVNQGTVKNLLSGLKRARGKYVYITSPGDMLYNDTVLRDFFHIAEEKSAKIMFGDAVYYSCDNDVVIYEDKCSPKRPECYSEEKTIPYLKSTFFFGGYILGASFFRETETARKYFRMIEPHCKYVEDNTSTAFALAAEERVLYCPVKMIWYEYGDGVSTSENSKWKQLLDKDFEENFKMLRKIYPKDEIIQAAYEKNVLKKGKFALLIHYPRVAFRAFYCHLTEKRNVKCSPADVNRLKKMLKV